MSKNNYKTGDWNIICDVCAKKFKASEAKQRWDGLVVCPDDFEHRHPQDFVKAQTDKITVPFTRPIPTEVFTEVPYIDINNPMCTLSGNSAIPGRSIPGCFIPNILY